MSNFPRKEIESRVISESSDLLPTDEYRQAREFVKGILPFDMFLRFNRVPKYDKKWGIPQIIKYVTFFK